jgi:hypothetical protein
MGSDLLLKFREANTPFGVTRETLQKLTEKLGTKSDTMTIHYALLKLAKEILPAYEADEGPFSEDQLKFIRRKAQARLPKGKETFKKSLL